VNQAIASQLQKSPLHQLYSSLKIDQSLKKYVQDLNLKFNKEVTESKVDKTIKIILE